MAVSFNSYYLYKKYEKRANQPWLPVYPETLSIDGNGSMPKVLKTSGDPVCYVEPQERWVDTDGYTCLEVQSRTVTGTPYCDNGDKKADVLTEISYDSGATWNAYSSTTMVIESQSNDCVIYRNVTGTPYCEEYDKYAVVTRERSYNCGSTWEFVSSSTTLIEINAESCGWSPSLYSGQYLTFVARESGTFWTASNTGVEYSLDSGATWNVLAPDTNTPTIATGEKIMWKANFTGNTSFSVQKFNGSGSFDIEGNLMSLYYGDDFAGKTVMPEDNHPTILFGYYAKSATGDTYTPSTWTPAKVVNAKNLILPATSLGVGYRLMFQGCSTLITAPKLPATSLVGSCYEYMFRGCTSLIKTPELPATTLSSFCYRDMFAGCTSLTTAPELPALTMADYCYQSMFENCTGLTDLPVLPATTLSTYCYLRMFRGCTSITTVSTNYLPRTALAEGCYSEMFSGCISLTNAPELPATTLVAFCYGGMFAGCTSLTTAPELPAATLEAYCYQGMFSGCTSLNSVKCLATETKTTGDTYHWLVDVANSGTFTKATTMTSWTRGGNGVPYGWSILNQ